jgi:hypothetical protein
MRGKKNKVADECAEISYPVGLPKTRVKEELCWARSRKFAAAAQPEDATLGFSPNATSKISD